MATPSATHKQYDVVVVGASLSGLQAAHSVRAAGLTVRRGSRQPSGREALTAKLCEKGYNDLGASWINDTNQSKMFKLYQRYGIDNRDPTRLWRYRRSVSGCDQCAIRAASSGP